MGWETFEVLCEVLRFVDLASVELKQPWFLPIAAIAVQVITNAPVNAQTLPVMLAALKFAERLVTWIDPPPVIHAAEDTELVCLETSSIVKDFMTSGSGSALVEKLTLAECLVWSDKSDEFPQVLGSVGTCLPIIINSRLGSVVASPLQSQASSPHWSSLASPDRYRALFQQLEANKKDNRSFTRTISEMAREFYNARKAAGYS